MLGVERGEPWKSQDSVTETTVIITGHIPPASVTNQDMSRIQLATGRCRRSRHGPIFVFPSHSFAAHPKALMATIMSDGIGIANLPNQVRREGPVAQMNRRVDILPQRHKIVAKRGAHFTIMVVGALLLFAVRGLLF